MIAAAWSKEEFEQRLREKGRAYHIHHPFNRMLNSGRATPEQVRGWVANRFYYQIAIPIKDAAVLSNCPDPAVRAQYFPRYRARDWEFTMARTTLARTVDPQTWLLLSLDETRLLLAMARKVT